MTKLDFDVLVVEAVVDSLRQRTYSDSRPVLPLNRKYTGYIESLVCFCSQYYPLLDGFIIETGNDNGARSQRFDPSRAHMPAS